MEKRFSFGILRSEQTRLRGLCDTAGTVCLGFFAGEAFTVQPGFGKQPKRFDGEKKFMLRDGQASFVSFHVVLSCQAAFASAGK
jgi:hypothetical protein